MDVVILVLILVCLNAGDSGQGREQINFRSALAFPGIIQVFGSGALSGLTLDLGLLKINK